MSSGQPVVILRYDTKNRLIFNVWEDQAELDPEQLLLSNASLLLHKPKMEEHSGLYTCTISGVQSKHIIQTDVNITASSGSKCSRLEKSMHLQREVQLIESVSAGEGELKAQRSWWCTAASLGFVLFVVVVMLSRCVRQKSKTPNA